MTRFYILVSIISAVVVAAVIYGFTVVGSPLKRQAIKTDQKRASDFSSLSYNIQTYFSTNKKLPEKLADVPNASLYINDPKTKQPYEYSIVSDTSYKLCTNFELDSSEVKNDDYDDYYPYPMPFLYNPPKALAQFSSPSSPQTTHKKGYDCITFNIPKYYQPSTYNPFSNAQAILKTTQLDSTAINLPKKGTIFSQGNANIIESKYSINGMSIYLLDTTGNILGQIKASGNCIAANNTTCKVYWEAEIITTYNNGISQLTNVEPKNYKIGIVSAYNTLIGITEEFTIAVSPTTLPGYKDSRRLTDIKIIRDSLGAFYVANNRYPVATSQAMPNFNDGNPALKTFLNPWPAAPTPAEGSCTETQNTYRYTQLSSVDYTVTFCLGAAAGGYAAGLHTASVSGIR